ncbi:hypothetical protein C8R44DRAFT_764580 [Mycena epipterygia]|nr:hypothetical protein C8R44DRAFT_764580 [Mycena epipterygia]
MDARPYQRYPWPWGQPSILTSRAEEERRQANSWLDADWEEDGSGSDYVPSDSESTGSNATSDSGATSDSSRQDISDSEQADIDADAKAGWPSSPTPSQKKVDQREDLARRVAELVKAEQDAAAAYNPDEVVSLLTQLYELFIAMGHWPEGSLRYPPHADPSVNEQLAQQLGYAPAAVSLMRQLPYLTWKANRDTEIIARTRFADYTREDDLKEGRHPTPYQYLDGCPDLDPWLLPLVLPNNGGWNIMLDTNLGIIRAYNNDASPPQNTIEWRRHDAHRLSLWRVISQS